MTPACALKLLPLPLRLLLLLFTTIQYTTTYDLLLLLLLLPTIYYLPTCLPTYLLHVGLVNSWFVVLGPVTTINVKIDYTIMVVVVCSFVRSFGWEGGCPNLRDPERDQGNIKQT